MKRSIKKTRSVEYYLSYSGKCRRVLVDKNNRIDEFPYSRKKAKRCPFNKNHPHRTQIAFNSLKVFDNRNRLVLSAKVLDELKKDGVTHRLRNILKFL